MTVTKQDALKHMLAGGLIKFTDGGRESFRKIVDGNYFIRINGAWVEAHTGLTTVPDFYTLLPFNTAVDPLPESVRNWVESVRINIEETPSASETEILNFFDSKFPKPKPPTWWEELARELEAMNKNNAVHGGFKIAADMVRTRGKLHDSK